MVQLSKLEYWLYSALMWLLGFGVGIAVGMIVGKIK